MKNNVTLIGMPGSGKSTVGVVLAKMLGFKFIDSDLVIQEREQKLLWQIIESEGIEGFWKIEESVNANFECENAVIATGGSAIYGAKAMEHLREISTVVYLKLDCAEIASRLGDLGKRGVTLPDGWTLEDLYNERTPMYEKYAHIIADCSEGQLRDTARMIANLVPRPQTPCRERP